MWNRSTGVVSRRFHRYHSPHLKNQTPAIYTQCPPTPKTLGHFHDFPQKNFTAAKNIPPTKPPRIQPLISTLSPDTIEAIIAYCEETSSYKEAAEKIHQHLGVKISSSRLSKLYTRHGIAEDDQTRAEIISAHENQNPNPLPNAQIIRAKAKELLELRLLELSARRDHDTSQLKELFQIITRLEALALSERRAVVAERRIALAEKRDQRQTEPPAPQPSLSPLQIKRRVRISLGKSTEDIDAAIAREAASNQRPSGTPHQTAATSDGDDLIPLYTKLALGKEITIGDELLASDHHVDNSPRDIQSTTPPAQNPLA